MAVRNAVSIVAEALDCDHPDASEAAYMLGDPDAVVAQARPIWTSWESTEDQAADRPSQYKPVATAKVLGCSCGRGGCGREVVDIDVVQGIDWEAAVHVATGKASSDPAGHPVSAIRRVTAFSALRRRDFRIFWIGFLTSMSGSWMQVFAVGWLVVQLAEREGAERAALYLGLVGFSRVVPGLVVGLVAGAVVDARTGVRCSSWRRPARSQLPSSSPPSRSVGRSTSVG